MTDASALVGTWQMVAWQREIVATGETFDAAGPHPTGYIHYAPDGRMFAFLLTKDRTRPAGSVPTAEEKVRLFDSMIAYGGTYTVDGENIVHHIDVSWNEVWTGTDLPRSYRIEGDTLTITGELSEDPYTGQMMAFQIVFQRVPSTAGT